MYARVSQFQDDPTHLDEAERFAEEKIVPQVDQIPGFAGLLSMVDRATGRSLAVTFWETEEALRASEREADRIREESTAPTGATISSVDRYEVTLRVGL